MRTEEFRPLIEDSLDKFRFGTAALVLRFIATNGSVGNSNFINHLSAICENLHLLWLAPETDFTKLRTYSVPDYSGLEISPFEKSNFENEKKRFTTALLSLGMDPLWDAAGALLKSYYCLANGANLSAIMQFGRTLRHLENTAIKYPSARTLLPSVDACVLSSTQTQPDCPREGLQFSFYMEYDRLRNWIKSEGVIDIYNLQKNITPRFNFGAG